MEKQPTTETKRPVKGRIRPALDTAIRLIVEEGRTQADAAKAVGMNQVSLSLALRKPHVIALRAAVKRAWLDSKTDKAWVTLANLADNAASEDVRYKSAKLFLEAAGELDGGRDRGDAGPRSVVQILINHPQVVGEGMAAGQPGVIEIIRTGGRSDGRYGIEGP